MATTPDARQEAVDLSSVLATRLEQARRELVETSTRSRLLHTPQGSLRQKAIEVYDEVSDHLFRLLVTEGKQLTFIPAPDARDDEEDPTALAQPEDGDGSDGPARRHTDTKLQTALSSKQLQSKLRTISYDARASESEQGVNILYLALGFLRWTEPARPATPRLAPLILIPANLSRASATERFKLTYSGEDLGTNLSLQLRLKEVGVELPDLPSVEDITPSEYANAVTRAVAGMPGWEVLTNRIVLGFYSFAKLLMYRDLDPANWPLNRNPLDHPLIGGLLGGGFRSDDASRPGDEVNVDTVVDIGACGHVVDADGSQALAISDVDRGNNLVIQGPPGTGKSQTITNLIASAVREGKRVLFIAEKIAALSVVHNNLSRIGLGPLCLELHSHKARKKEVLQSLQETYGRTSAPLRADEQIAVKLRATRDLLNEYACEAHKPLESSGMTPFEVFGRLARLTSEGVRPADFAIRPALGWTRSEIEQRIAVVSKLANHVAQMGTPAAHPWKGVGLDAVLPQDASRFGDRAGQIATSLAEEVLPQLDALATRSGVRIPNEGEATSVFALGEHAARSPGVDPRALGDPSWADCRADITKSISAGLTHKQTSLKLGQHFLPEAWQEDLSGMRRALAAHESSWLRWLHKEYRAAVAQYRGLTSGDLPSGVASRVAALDLLRRGQTARRVLTEASELCKAAFGDRWTGVDSDWAHLGRIITWVESAPTGDLPLDWRQKLAGAGDLIAFGKEAASASSSLGKATRAIADLLDDLGYDVAEGLGSDAPTLVPLRAMLDRLRQWSNSPASLQEWCTWRVWRREAESQGVTPVVERLADGRCAPESAASITAYAVHEELAREIFRTQPVLAAFDGRGHENTIVAFRSLDRQRLALSRSEVTARHSSGMPRGGRDIGEMGVLAREWGKKSRHMPLRKLTKAAGQAMQHIKPVWMMSPMSLAQYVEPGALEFDLVLMDEASQIRPVEALGAIARGTQLVVVGDDKQLPPTSFFDRIANDDGEAEDGDDFQVADLESILGLCAAQGIPDRMLRWHYRSQHESLIAISNLEFYRRLFIVPSATSEGLGLAFRKVQGTYDRGRTRANRDEARAIARAVVAHAARFPVADRHPRGLSLGVGTFSVAQRDAVLDELELLLRERNDLSGFFNPEAPEPFFVKNLESIQGDERDVILISIGYGRDADGYMAMGFGPLSSEGGERRLNVLISRARRRCEVYSTITSGDIDLNRARGAGVRVLKTFLHYAETGVLELSTPGSRPIDSDFEADVGAVLAASGYDVQHQVGVAGFFVDIGVRDPDHPGTFLLGVECDGASYHSSRSARDRDRLREEVLRLRGWRVHRIWSTDWFKNRHSEISRLLAAIEAAKLHAFVPSDPTPAVGEGVSGDHPHATRAMEGEATDVPSPVAPNYYVEADLSESISLEPHEVWFADRVRMISQIVRVEGPIHAEEVGRRYAAVCGADRAGSRIQKAVLEALRHAARKGELVADGQFYAVARLKEVEPRDRSRVSSGTLRRPDMLPPVEIRTGLRRVVREQLGVEPQALVVEVARMLGFQRTGSELQKVLEDNLRSMLGDASLLLRDGRIYAG